MGLRIGALLLGPCQQQQSVTTAVAAASSSTFTTQSVNRSLLNQTVNSKCQCARTWIVWTSLPRCPVVWTGIGGMMHGLGGEEAAQLQPPAHSSPTPPPPLPLPPCPSPLSASPSLLLA